MSAARTDEHYKLGSSNAYLKYRLSKLPMSIFECSVRVQLHHPQFRHLHTPSLVSYHRCLSSHLHMVVPLILLLLCYMKSITGHSKLTHPLPLVLSGCLHVIPTRLVCLLCGQARRLALAIFMVSASSSNLAASQSSLASILLNIDIYTSYVFHTCGADNWALISMDRLYTSFTDCMDSLLIVFTHFLMSSWAKTNTG
jgi:hypothetical protein